MSFSSSSDKRRRRMIAGVPAAIDSLESRRLLTTPNVLTPQGTVVDATPEFTWEAVDTAVSYDLWVTSLETFETVLVQRGIPDTKYTPPEGSLAQGRIRIWVNANLAGGGTSGWSPSAEAVIQAPPSITGPTGTGAQNLVSDNTPEISWTAPSAARRFQIWVSDLTEKARLEEEASAAGSTTPVSVTDYATVYTVENFQRLKDHAGNDVLDAFGNPIHDEVRSFILPADPTKTGSAAIVVDPAFVVDTGTDEITWNNHGLAAGTTIHYSAGGGTPINGLSDDTDYYVISVSPNTIRLAATAQDALAQQAVDLTGTGSGTMHRFSVVNPPRVLDTGRYRIWMRTVDLSGRVSDWSAPRTIDVGAAPGNLTPDAPSFQASPQLRWDNVARATHYEIFVARDGGPSPFFRRVVPAAENVLQQSAYIIQSTTGSPIVDDNDGVVETGESPRLDADGNEVRYNIEPGDYTWWVRAVNQGAVGSTIPVVYGAWSAPTKFSTIKAPVVTAPVPVSGVVTASRPTVSWSKIHGAARYQVLIHKFNSRPPFLDVQTPNTSLTVPNDMPAGTYTIWVRAIDTRGGFSPWSTGYSITATGGAPVVTALPGVNDPAFWTFSWVPVDDAASYEVWVSQDGVNFRFLQVSGITTTTFDPNIPFNSGAHRVWVRAVRADGTTGPWSTPVSFIVADSGGQPEAAGDDPLQTIVTSIRPALTRVDSSQPEAASPDRAVPAIGAGQHNDRPSTADDRTMPYSADQALPDAENVPYAEGQELPPDLLSALAAECVDTAWWDNPSAS